MLWGLFIGNLKAEQREFVLDSLLYRKPVTRVKQMSDVGKSGGSEDKSSSIVLDLLEF